MIYLNTEQSAQFIRKALTKRGLNYKHSLTTLLAENRRSPLLRTKTGRLKRKGNRYKFGFLPYKYVGIIAVYTRKDLTTFTEDTLIPLIEKTL